MAISFDGATKIISLSAGTTSLSIRDLWSRWVDWLSIAENTKYAIAMSEVGGDDIDLSAGTKIPAYVFLENGWRLRPFSGNHTLNVYDGVLLVAGGGGGGRGVGERWKDSSERWSALAWEIEKDDEEVLLQLLLELEKINFL